MMADTTHQNAGASLLRWGWVAAIAGAAASVAAGVGFGDLPSGAAAVMDYLSTRPGWYWPLVGAGFVVGALLWLGATFAMGSAIDGPQGRSLWRLGLLAMLVGVAVHTIDSAVMGSALGASAEAWQGGAAGQASLLDSVALILQVHDGLWAGVIALFHGLPFVLLEAALLVGGGFADWIGWSGLIVGAGSLVYGGAMFLLPGELPRAPYAALGVAVSAWMVVVGVRMYRRSHRSATAAAAAR